MDARLRSSVQDTNGTCCRRDWPRYHPGESAEENKERVLALWQIVSDLEHHYAAAHGGCLGCHVLIERSRGGDDLEYMIKLHWREDHPTERPPDTDTLRSIR